MAVCIESPGSGATVAGDVTVSASRTLISGDDDPGARRVVFTLNGADLLTDYEAPYEFVLPTESFADGPMTLEAYALARDDFVTQAARIDLVFDNGNAEAPPILETFSPTEGRVGDPADPFVVMATGDGPSGESRSNAVAEMIRIQDPNLFLYLGDVYQDGTYTEFVNYYGEDRLWGTFRDITNPTLGNHEVEGGVAEGYDRYWGTPPRAYSFDADGWHFVTIDSNSQVASGPGSPQYDWLLADLAASDATCTVAFMHHPVFSIGSQGSNERLDAVWSLLVNEGVDLVLTGHEHNYQRWEPLGADGAPDAAGATQFVVGSGGHGIRPFDRSDASVLAGFDSAVEPDTRGALRLELDSGGARFTLLTSDGQTLDSGEVPCR